MKKQIGILLLLSVTLFGCLGDDVDRPTVVPQLVFAPALTYYKAITNTTDVQIRWNRSTTDLQKNFKGYFVKLFSSQIDSTNLLGEDVTLEELDSVHVGPGDTSYTFHNLSLLKRYTAEVFGERFSNDTPVYSENKSYISFTYDSRGVSAPKNIYASSSSATIVNLFWDSSQSESQQNFAGYIIRYRDTSQTNSHVIEPPGGRISAKGLNPGSLTRFASLTVPGNTFPPIEREYKFWVKAIRTDSVESDDSIGISWSGAERLGGLQVLIDTGVFIGGNGTGTGYAISTADVSNSNTYFTPHFDGTTLTLTGLHTTLFAKRIDMIDSTGMDHFGFSSPINDNEYTETSLALPTPTGNGGAQVYALMPSGRVRLFIPSIRDSSGVSRYVSTASNGQKSITVTASYQPISPAKLPYF
ncbi:MAG TPA: fibronectin type III domain-containing protein [Candidatus Kapabacteria bacterium]|nr:fibronectin type III domain-containing protein [Candidatus Kapabacteria bacterium]